MQYANADIATLMEKFPFVGIREKSGGKLVGYAGHFHSGTSGCNRVDSDHEGRKLFQGNWLETGRC